MRDLLDKLSLEDITSFLEHGKLDKAPEGVPEYLSILEKVRGMLLRFDRYPNDDIIINHLVFNDHLTKHKARTIIAEAREYFYCDSIVSKEAWRNIYAEKMDQLANAAILAAKDAKDYVAIRQIYKDAFEIRGGNKDDAEEIPYDVLNQPRFTVYTLNIEDLGLPKSNRNSIKALIESKTLELSEKEKNQIFREADILPFKVFPNEQEDTRKA
jgi:hypothetical protein